MAANYPTKSVISSSDWQKMESVFRRLKKVCLDMNFPIDYVWQNIPVGEYLERVRQMRCEEKLTHDQMRFFDKLDIDLQYRERHWYYMYERAKQYYERYGHLSVSKKEDYTLQKWIGSQRQKYYEGPRKRKNRMDRYSPLSKEQMQLLEDIEIVWDASTTWGKYIPLLKKYYEEMHDTNVPSTFYVGHLNLGYWVSRLRNGELLLTEEQKAYLNEMGFDWEYRSIKGTSFPEQATFYYFSFWYTDALSRYKMDGIEFDIYSPQCKIAIEYDGIAWHRNKLDRDNKKDELCKKHGIKLIRIREEGLPQTKYAKNYFLSLPFATDNFDKVIKSIYYNEFGNPLIDIDTRAHGFEILTNYRKLEDMAFYRHLEELKEYIQIHHRFPPSNHKSHAGLLGWIYGLRRIYIGQAHGIITNEQKEELDKIGFVWNPYEEKLNDIYIHLKCFIEQGNNYLSSKYVDPVDGFKLGDKIRKLKQRGPLRTRYCGTPLNNEQFEKFDHLGVNWQIGGPLLKPKM